jgi:calcium/calmodulin-dependent protein kinase (CaM kinase) II/calcium/calmodulin-dependent protein kinase I/doublecortin-like kinase 3
VIFRKILEAFVYLHEQGIAHRDVKLENILIGLHHKDQINVKIIDFGFSCRCTLSKKNENFMAEMK